MSIPVADFILDLLKQAGVSRTPEIDAVLSAKELTAVQLPDELTGKIKSGLINVEAAKEHPEVRKSLKGEFLGSHERKIWQHLRDNYGWTEEEFNDWKRQSPSRSISDRVEELFDTVKARAEAAGAKKSGLNPDELKRQLNEEIRKDYATKLEANHKTISEYEKRLSELSDLTKQLKADKETTVFSLQRDYYLDSIMNALPVRKELTADTDAREVTFGTIRKKLLEQAELVKSETGTWELRQKADPSAKFLKENKPISPEDFLKDVAASFLDPNATKTAGKTTPPAGGGAGAGTGTGKPITPGNPNVFNGPVKMI